MSDLRQLFLEHIQITHAALDQAKAELEKKAASEKEVAALIPQVVEVLVKFARIDPIDREKAAQTLTDPASVLKVLLNTADPEHNIKPASLGGGTGETKTASDKGYYLGQKVPQERESDRAFRERMLS